MNELFFFSCLCVRVCSFLFAVFWSSLFCDVILHEAPFFASSFFPSSILWVSSKGTSDSRHQLFFNVGCVFTYFLEVFFSLLFYFRLSNSKSKRKAGVPAIVAFLPFLSFTANYMFQEPLVMAVFFFRVSLQLLRENQDTHIRWELSLETSLSTIYNGPFSFSFFAHPLLRWRFIERRKKKRVFFPFFYYCYSSATKHKHTHTHTHICVFLAKCSWCPCCMVHVFVCVISIC